ncbi:hypothetical protein CVT26_004584 [Gymnopilus dilepis]|uniref:Uncharacterized protein n=1 Tax=Gymnopilus dilepis TaxID=231916 RepID=A0A409WBY6_9AGAR|nr:hypothetical protein CVT26_004584 [Gymnopilus dilepis]
MGKQWTTPEQRVWLKERIPKYQEAQKKCTVSRFHMSTQAEWFEIYPQRKICFPEKGENDTLTTEEQAILDRAEEARKTQLVHWFEWNANPVRRAETRDGSLFLKALGLNKSQMEKPTERQPQRVKAYQKLFKDKIKKAVDAEAARRGVKTQKEILGLRRSLTGTMMEAEPQEVQERIDKYIQDWKDKREKAAQEKPEDWVPTADELQSAVLALPSIMAAALKAMSDATGWVIYAVAAGPHGLDDGNIWMQDLYVGPKSTPEVRAARVVKKAGEGTQEEGSPVGVRIPAPSEVNGTTASPSPADVSLTPVSNPVASEVEAGYTNADGPTADASPSADASSSADCVERSRADEVHSDDEDDPLASFVAQLRGRAKQSSDSGSSKALPSAPTAESSNLGAVGLFNITRGSAKNKTPHSDQPQGEPKNNAGDVTNDAQGDQQADIAPTQAGSLELTPAIPAYIRLSTPEPGAPSEPIEFAFARAGWEFRNTGPISSSPVTNVGPVSSNPTISTEATASNVLPPSCIDPALLVIPKEPTHVPGTPDYTISGARLASSEAPTQPTRTAWDGEIARRTVPFDAILLLIAVDGNEDEGIPPSISAGGNICENGTIIVMGACIGGVHDEAHAAGQRRRSAHIRRP